MVLNVFQLFPRRSLEVGGVLALGLLLHGCFDVNVVNVRGDAGGSAGGSGSNVPAHLIDDFEDGNRVPRDLQFGPWRCFSYNSSGGVPAKCAVSSPGYNYSKYGYSVDFELADASNGIDDHAIMSLESGTTAPLDLSSYEKILFSAKLVPRDKPFPNAVSLSINLFCSTISQQVVPYRGVLSIGNAAEPTSSWARSALAMSDFIQFKWNKDILPINAHDCAARVDGISFEFELPQLDADASVDGQSIAATLSIDDVYLQ